MHCPICHVPEVLEAEGRQVGTGVSRDGGGAAWRVSRCHP